MALLTKTGAQGRRFATGDRLRAWWAMRLQKRRRGAGGGTPAAPVIVSHNLEYGGNGWFDVVLAFTFYQGRFPDGSIEVYWARASGGWVSNYVGAVSSAARSYRHAAAFDDYTYDTVAYTMRYRFGTGVIGPFSQPYQFIYLSP